MKSAAWGLVLGLVFVSTPAFAAIGPCTEDSRVTGNTTSPVLSSTPARLCGVSILATGANGFCGIVDSPNGLDTHAQARFIAEPGAATAGNSASVSFGDQGYPTRFGLAAYASNAQCIVHWGP